MKTGSGAFSQCYNGQAAIDDEHQLIVACSVQQSAADVNALVPLVDHAVKNCMKKPRMVLADAGYASEANFEALENRKISACVALGREGKKSTRKPADRSTATGRMAAKMRTKRGRLRYKRRKAIAEAPFGWMKQRLGFRQFGLRGIRKTSHEFTLVCLALNLRRMTSRMAWVAG